jgi:GWxTD domain-containing protein
VLSFSKRVKLSLIELLTWTAVLLLFLPGCAFATEKPSKSETHRRKAAATPMTNPYWNWANREVGYIITVQEKAAFMKLTSEEMREQFIEQFWERRDPHPGSPENDFKKEYYRRIIFANQHFSTHIPGWKTDRGRDYIKYGPSDEIEIQPAPVRSEIWRYHYLNGFGSNVEIKFSDPKGNGEYVRELEPGETNPPEPLPTLNISNSPGIGMTPKSSSAGGPTHVHLYIGTTVKPQTEFADLRAILTSKLKPPDSIPFVAQTYFDRATGEMTVAYLTMLIPGQELKFVRRGDQMHAELQIYGQFETITGRIAQVFEKSFNIDIREGDFQGLPGRTVSFQDSFPLSPGRYKLSVVLKDAQSGEMGSLSQRFRVPWYEVGLLTNSSIFLGRGSEQSDAGKDAGQPFLVGGFKVQPDPTQVFSNDDTITVLAEFYDLGVDQESFNPSIEVHYQVLKDGNIVLNEAEDPTAQSHASWMFVAQKNIPLGPLQPGKYTLRISLFDHVRNQTLSPSTDFEVR